MLCRIFVKVISSRISAKLDITQERKLYPAGAFDMMKRCTDKHYTQRSLHAASLTAERRNFGQLCGTRCRCKCTAKDAMKFHPLRWSMVSHEFGRDGSYRVCLNDPLVTVATGIWTAQSLFFLSQMKQYDNLILKSGPCAVYTPRASILITKFFNEARSETEFRRLQGKMKP